MFEAPPRFLRSLWLWFVLIAVGSLVIGLDLVVIVVVVLAALIVRFHIRIVA